MLIQMVVSELDGVTSAESDHRTGITEVVFDDSVLGPEEIVATIVRAGYGAEPADA
jgi:copper chaperone CopZ